VVRAELTRTLEPLRRARVFREARKTTPGADVLPEVVLRNRVLRQIAQSIADVKKNLKPGINSSSKGKPN